MMVSRPCGKRNGNYPLVVGIVESPESELTGNRSA
jgi:hypothetical protein